MNQALDKKEILRYLGYRGQTMDAHTNALIDTCMQQLEESAKPRFIYRTFTLLQNEKTQTLSLLECGLTICSKNLFQHLLGCQNCVILAATLGIEADNLIRIAQSESMSRAVILDACAADMIEKLCDFAETEIAETAESDGLFLRPRFSPGYGDCPLTLQNDIGRILDTSRKIGLTITDRALMLPRKSVTAFIGLGKDKKKKAPPSCDTCNMRGRCQYQREGITCGR